MANMANIIHSPSAVSPNPGNVNSIFFSGGNTSLVSSSIPDKSLSVKKGGTTTTSIANRSRSPSPITPKPSISIKIDPAEDPPKEQFDSENVVRTGGRRTTSPSRSKSKNRVPNIGVKDSKNGKGGGAGGVEARGGGISRKSRKDNHDIFSDFRRKYIGPMGRYYEPDRDLIRRQQAMIAVQKMTGLEEIEYKRDMLRIKVENRRRADALSTPRSGAVTSLRTVSSFKSLPGTRSPSPSRFTVIDRKTLGEFDVSKKLADSTSQAIRVTKKVSNMNKKLTPKIVSSKAAVITVKK